MQAGVLRQAVERADQAGVALSQIGDQVGSGGDGHLRCGGGRRRSAVGGEVDQGGIGLVADRGDQGNATGGGGADDDFLVEGHQVFQAAAAPSDDQDVGAGRV